jgi:hypothetical protein
MSTSNNNGISSDSQISSDPQNPNHQPANNPVSQRPAKIQKTTIITPIITNFTEKFTSTQSFQQINLEPHVDMGDNSGIHMEQEQFSQYQQPGNQESLNPEMEDEEPFCFYQETHVEDSVRVCKNSMIGKILSDKPIPIPTLHSTLSGIWCNPLGFRITEIEGKLFQISMDREQDLNRIIKGSPWIIRNCWLVLHAWDRKINPNELEFTKVPLWVQIWGLPLHCKSIIMGEQIGSQIGQVLDVGTYEYPENAKIVKTKILFDISHPIRAGLYIGSEVDGINWVDFRYENLPMFCFKCGLVGHNEENCISLSPQVYQAEEGSTNPRGAWLRSRIYGRRTLEKKDKVFSSNPLKSLSGKQFSPVPKGQLGKFANLSVNQHQNSPTERRTQSRHVPNSSQLANQCRNQPVRTLWFNPAEKTTTQPTEEQKTTKRKLLIGEDSSSNSGINNSQVFGMAGLDKGASQAP